MFKSAIVLTLALALTGCVSLEVAPIGTVHEARSIDYPIDLYMPDRVPVALLKHAGEHKQPEEVPPGSVVVGRIEASGKSAASWQRILNNARAAARNLGGSALVYEEAGATAGGSIGSGVSYPVTNGSTPYSVGFGGSTAVPGKTVTLTVIRYPAND